jgi:hypothetical protein
MVRSTTFPFSSRLPTGQRVAFLTTALALGLGAVASCAQAPVTVPAPVEAGKSAKRAGPDEVAPVRLGDTIYEAIHWGRARGLAHDGGYVRALDAATGRELWVLEVYRVDYDPRRERDVQDVFIDSLRAGASGRTLEVTDEAGRRYEIDLQARTVRAR